jgi:hypothetical protein
MAKGKKGKAKQGGGKKKKGPKGKKGARGNKMSMAGGHGMLAMQVCSVTNPFCPEAKGARWPDDSYQRSVGYPIQNSVAVTTNAAGLASVLYGPSLDCQYNPCTVAGVTATAGAFTTLPGATAAATGVSRWRLTSYGLKVSCIGTPMTVSGRVRIRLFSPEPNTLSLATFDIGTSNADAAYDIPLARVINEDLFINAGNLGTLGRLYQNLYDPAIATQLNPGWQYIAVSVEGAPASTAVLSIEHYYNYELCYLDSSSTSTFCTAPPANSLVVRESAANTLADVGNFVEGTASKVDTIFKSKAFKYAAGFAGYLMGGPAGGATALAITNAAQNVD